MQVLPTLIDFYLELGIAVECTSTESVWACLTCGHMGCGRYVEQHAQHHATSKQHPLVFDINDKTLYWSLFFCLLPFNSGPGIATATNTFENTVLQLLL